MDSCWQLLGWVDHVREHVEELVTAVQGVESVSAEQGVELLTAGQWVESVSAEQGVEGR